MFLFQQLYILRWNIIIYLMQYMSYVPSLCPSPGFVNDRPHFFINVFLKLKLSLFDLKCLMNSLSFSSLWSAPLAPLQQQHIFMSVKCDTHTHTRMSPVLHCSLSLSLSRSVKASLIPPLFLPFLSLFRTTVVDRQQCWISKLPGTNPAGRGWLSRFVNMMDVWRPQRPSSCSLEAAGLTQAGQTEWGDDHVTFNRDHETQ